MIHTHHAGVGSTNKAARRWQLTDRCIEQQQSVLPGKYVCDVCDVSLNPTKKDGASACASIYLLLLQTMKENGRVLALSFLTGAFFQQRQQQQQLDDDPTCRSNWITVYSSKQ